MAPLVHPGVHRRGAECTSSVMSPCRGIPCAFTDSSENQRCCSMSLRSLRSWSRLFFLAAFSWGVGEEWGEYIRKAVATAALTGGRRKKGGGVVLRLFGGRGHKLQLAGPRGV